MILIPRWEEDPGDTVLAALTESLLEHVKGLKRADVRLLSKEITEGMQERLSRQRVNPEEVAIENASDSGEGEEGAEISAMEIEQARERLRCHSAFADIEMIKR